VLKHEEIEKNIFQTSHSSKKKKKNCLTNNLHLPSSSPPPALQNPVPSATSPTENYLSATGAAPEGNSCCLTCKYVNDK